MTKIDNGISGKLALITGASGGIGTACAVDLWNHGASLALTYHQNEASLARLLKEELTLGSNPNPRAKVSIHHADMAAADFSPLVSQIRDKHERAPDILVSNAGYGKRIPSILDIPLDEFDLMLTVNLRASFLLCQAVMPSMTARKWGRVVFVSSIAGHGGGINGCHYAASKAGLTGMMRNLAQKHAADGITVNDVAPAMIGKTGMIPDAESVQGTPGDVKNIPVGRLGTPQEVANVVTMFCRTGYMTGQSVLLSGGLK